MNEQQKRGRPSKTPEQHFWANANKGLDTECWIWTGPKFRTGYGACSIGTSRVGLAHRVGWNIQKPDDLLKEGEHLHHQCGHVLCVNAAHLVKVTKQTHSQVAAKQRTACSHGHPYVEGSFILVKSNSGSMVRQCKICRRAAQQKLRIAFRAEHPAKPHANAVKTHCKRGHEFTEENTRITSIGGRQCRTCWKILMERHKPNRVPRGTPRLFCKHGHEMTPENTYTYTYKNGKTTKSCRLCIAGRIRKHRGKE